MRNFYIYANAVDIETGNSRCTKFYGIEISRSAVQATLGFYVLINRRLGYCQTVLITDRVHDCCEILEQELLRRLVATLLGA